MDSNDWGLCRVRKHVPEIETGIIWLLPWVQSEEDKDGHIEDYRRAQRIALDKTTISKNAGQYNLEKLILNSMYGKRVQNQNMTHTTIVNSNQEFYELLTCPGTEVTNQIFPNDDVAWVSWKYSEDDVAAGKTLT
jgi:hypothetical protein